MVFLMSWTRKVIRDFYCHIFDNQRAIDELMSDSEALYIYTYNSYESIFCSILIL